MKTHRVIALTLGFASSLSLAAQRMGTDPLPSPFPGSNSVPGQNTRPGFSSSRVDDGSVSGMVQDTQNHPLKDVRVELTDGTGVVVNSSYTNSSGQFEFSHVPGGGYRIVATSGLQQTSDRVEVSSFNTVVNIRMQGNGKPEDGVQGHSISVAQFRVPGKAREEYRKAHDGLEKGKLEEAGKHLARALEICPNYAEALTLHGILELNQRNSQSAIADLDKAIQADGNYGLAYVVMGSALNMQSKFDDAIRSLERGQSLSPDSWQSYFEMGKSYIGKTDYPSALRELDRAQSLAPAEYPLIYLLRAHALLALKQFPEAMTALQAYLQKDPNGANTAQAQKMLQQAQAFVASKK